MHDILSNVPEKTIHCLDKGFVTLVDMMPRLAPEGQTTADHAIVQMARVSYGAGTKTINEDQGLIRYLMRHAHTTPFEGVEFKFHCKMPIFVARQWIRHRTANVNEISGRYSVLKDDFYYPQAEEIRRQSKTNKQGGDQQIEEDVAVDFLDEVGLLCEEAYRQYEAFLEKGISREQARMLLPVNLYTEWYWKIDLHNLFHFLALRCDAHAQYEIRVFAEAMRTLIQPTVPLALAGWEDYHDHRGAIKLTRLEIEALKAAIGFHMSGRMMPAPALQSENKREQQEWVEKGKKLGLWVDETWPPKFS